MSRKIPTPISTTPTYYLGDTYEEVPTMRSPAITPVSTETLTFCIALTTTNKVRSMSNPETIMSAHCQILGTMSQLAGKKIGKAMLQQNRNQWTMVYQLDLLNLKTYELTHPSISPGRNQRSFVLVQFSSISKEPSIMLPKQSQVIPIRCPRVNYQKIAKMSPPEPFQPQQMLSTTAAKATTHCTFNRLSSESLVRQGQSMQRRIIPIQLTRKAVRDVTNAY